MGWRLLALSLTTCIILVKQSAVAQQVISRGDWILQAPQEPSLGVIGVYPSVADCQAAWRANYAATVSRYEEALQLAQNGYENPQSAAMAGPPGQADEIMASTSAKDNFLIQQLNMTKTVMGDMQTATCAQH